MTTSDSEDFESADEGVSSETAEERHITSGTTARKSIAKDDVVSTNRDEKLTDVNEENTHRDLPKPINLKPQEVLAEKVSKGYEETDGWDDFDIDNEVNSVNNEATAKPISKKADAPVKTDGWGDFDDWGTEEVVPENKSDKRESPSSKCTPGEDPEIRSIADRLSIIGEKQNASQENTGGWAWGGWVSTITSHVSQGLSTVTNVLESGIGAPDPEEFAKEIKEERKKKEPSPGEESKDLSRSSSPKDPTSNDCHSEELPKKNEDNSFGFGQLMSSVSQITKLVETTGTKVFHGGLDTLENIGKKTMQVLQEGDPGLAKKRAMLGMDSGAKPVLSHILREAKERAEDEDRQRAQKKQAKEVHYETLFDDFAGLVHLEALEMLSKQSDLKIQSLLLSMEGEQLQELKETLCQVKELCELPEDEDEEDDETTKEDAQTISEGFRTKMVEASQDIGVKINFEPIVRLWHEHLEWLLPQIQTEEPVVPQPREVLKRAISCLAHTTALAVELYHKTAELMLVKNRRSTADEADGLMQLTTVLTRHISSVASLFTQLLGKMIPAVDQAEEINSLITNVFLEAGNSSTYIQDAFLLTLPILQCGAT